MKLRKVLFALSIFLALPILAHAYTGNYSIWYQPKGAFIPTNANGDTTGFGVARDACIKKGGGVIQIGPGAEGVTFTYPTNANLLILRSGTNGWSADPWSIGSSDSGIVYAIKSGNLTLKSFAGNGVGLQAAANYLPSGGYIFVGSGEYLIDSLSLYGHTTLEGVGIATKLKRNPGATGPAIREKTAAEGNPNGATHIVLKYLYIDGNSTTGNGIDLGNQGGFTLNAQAGLFHIRVTNFIGDGFRLAANTVLFEDLHGASNTVGLRTMSGSGSNKWYGIWMEGNTSENMIIGSSNETFFGIHNEENTVGSQASISVLAGNNSFYDTNIFLTQNRTDLITLAIGISGIHFSNLHVTKSGAQTWTNTFRHLAYGTGTGADVFITDFDDYRVGGYGKEYKWDSSTNRFISFEGGSFNNTVTSHLGPYSTSGNPGTGGAIRIIDGVTFPYTPTGIKAALADLPNKGGVIILPADSLHWGTDTLLINKPNVTFQGAGGRATVWAFSGTNQFITIGVDDGNHAGNIEAYDNGVSNVVIKGIRLVGPGKATTAVAITDLEGGSNEFNDLDIQNWGKGYFGIGADVSIFKEDYFQACQTGVHLGSRCDQNQFNDCYWAQCTFGLRDEYAYNARVMGGQFVFSDSADILADCPAAATRGGDIRGELALYVSGTWFESNTTVVGYNLPRHIWLGKDGTSGNKLTHFTIVGAYIFPASSTNFIEIDGADRIKLIGINQVGTLTSTPIKINNISGVFPNITQYGCSWTPTTVYSGAGSAQTSEALFGLRQINSVAFAASFTPTAGRAGEIVTVGNLTNNITINAPSDPYPGKILRLLFQQDGTGGRTITWNAVYKNSWSDIGNVANARASVTFVCYDGANWQQLGKQQGWDNALAGSTIVASDSLRANKGIYVGGQFVTAILRASATLDFNLAAVNCQDLTVTVAGAVVGDTVFIGVPNGSVTTDTYFTGWVSGASTVTIRACKLAGSPDPPSGTFKVTVVQ